MAPLLGCAIACGFIAMAPPTSPDDDDGARASPAMVIGAQTLAGAAVTAGLLPLAPVSPLLAGAAVAVVGDRLGDGRGAGAWATAGAAALGGWLGLFPATLPPALLIGGWVVLAGAQGGWLPFGFFLAGTLAIAVGALLVPPFAVGAVVGLALGNGVGATMGYALSAEDKVESDDGRALPGWWSPEG